MFFTKFFASVLLLSYARASINFYRSGWLDRVVQHRKNEFVKDIQKLPAIQIKASITTAPPGYVDSPDWNYDSATRLLTLIRASETSRDVYRVLRRALEPSRRIMNWEKTFKYFPRHKLVHDHDIYYDIISSAENATESWENDGKGPINDDSIVFVSNPVEAKLPSAQISVGMLKGILWNRSMAAREMPTTEKTTYPWKPMNKTTAAAPTRDSSDAATTAADGGGDANGTTGRGTGATDAETGTKAEGTEGGGSENTGVTGTGGAEGGETTAAATDGKPAAETEAPAAE